jgi:hypothetical protein
VITFETNNGNSNVVHISNKKHFYSPPDTQKRFVYMILSELERLAKNEFSARQKCIFGTPTKSVEPNTRYISSRFLSTL